MRRVALAIGLLLLLSGCAGGGTPTPRQAALPIPTQPTPRAGGSCHTTNGLPDQTCTPGAVQGGVTAQTICAPGYSTASVRPPVSYTTPLKIQQLKEYGELLTTAQVEEDHLIPLELAGSPTSPLNLWPQPRVGAAGQTAADKDLVENAAHAAVCAGKMALADAQAQIAANWQTLRASLQTAGLFTVANPNSLIVDDDDNG